MARWLPNHPHYEPAPRPAREWVKQPPIDTPMLFRFKPDNGYWTPNTRLPDETRPLLTDAERRILNKYTDETSAGHPTALHYESFNQALREPWKDMSDERLKAHRVLSDVFAKTPRMPQPVRVFRKLYIPDLFPHEHVYTKLRSLVGTDKTIRIPGYQSTSTDRATWWPKSKTIANRSVGLLILAHHGVDMQPYGSHSDESELLLPHNSKFKVLGIQSQAKLGRPNMPQYVASLEQVV
jgi:hypothetical protein